VRENLDMGAYGRRDKDAVKEDLERVFDLFPRMAERASQKGGTMSGGEQQMLAIGRALMSRPRVLLLDEPSMGLAPQFIRQVFSIIHQVNEQGTTVLLVEQNANQALAIADKAYVLETGQITNHGSGRELLADPAIKEAYLGVA
jgi:branched-chain amino acid transport system ATP-binding protein